MKAFYQGDILDESKIILSPENRSFLYGDGLFETMTSRKGTIKYLNHHLQRMIEGLKALSVTIPKYLEFDVMTEILIRLTRENKINDFAKIKIICWRSPGGTYSPTTSDGEILVTIKAVEQPKTKFNKRVSFSENIKNSKSGFSRFKTTNALKYVVAGLEKKNRNLDDIIILDEEGHISECLISNIFWVKDGKWFTSSLETGCIEGTSRRIIISETQKKGIIIEEVKFSKHEFLKSDSIFSTNSSGIQHILEIDGRSFRPEKSIENIYQPI